MTATTQDEITAAEKTTVLVIISKPASAAGRSAALTPPPPPPLKVLLDSHSLRIHRLSQHSPFSCPPFQRPFPCFPKSVSDGGILRRNYERHRSSYSGRDIFDLFDQSLAMIRPRWPRSQEQTTWRWTSQVHGKPAGTDIRSGCSGHPPNRTSVEEQTDENHRPTRVTVKRTSRV